MGVLSARVLAVVVRVVLVRPGVRVGVAQRAVTVQLVFDQLVGGRGHDPSG
jgi:hypothetical protein